jgi:hypothetical protein
MGKVLFWISDNFITSLKDDQVFVFGSNLSGIHSGGAAKIARVFGAEIGNPVGMQGQTYAIPTMDAYALNPLPIEKIKEYVDEFFDYAIANPHLTFLVTKIGCGIAEYKCEDIAPLFKRAEGQKNIHIPIEFMFILLNEIIEREKTNINNF